MRGGRESLSADPGLGPAVSESGLIEVQHQSHFHYLVYDGRLNESSRGPSPASLRLLGMNKIYLTNEWFASLFSKVCQVWTEILDRDSRSPPWPWKKHPYY